MEQLKIKDIMTTGAFAALYFMCVGLGTLIGIFFDKSGNMLYAPAFAAVLGATVYYLLIAKLQKFGPVTLLGVIMGLFFFLTGHFFAAMFPALIFGVLADVVASLGKYRSKTMNIISYCIFSFVNSGPIILMWVVKDAYVKSLLARGKDMAYIERVMYDFTLGHVSWFVATVVLGAIVGSLFAHQLIKKHFITSGMLS